MMKKFISIFFSVAFLTIACFAQQPKLIDKIVAKVGNAIVLRSDIESQYLQYLSQTRLRNEEMKCVILENLIIQKLLVNQAKLDSLVVSEAQVDDELDRRMRYFISQLGSQEKLESYLGKSIIEIKEELRDQIYDVLLSGQMQGDITKNLTITPSEVKEFYENTPKDSLPFINTEVEVAQILMYTKFSREAKEAAKNKLEELRARVAKGESFSTLAILYSQDPISAKQGGELGFVNRGDLVKSFESVAFKLKPGELSEVVETEYGFHILQLIERRGEQVNVRHILIKPEISQQDVNKVKLKMDTIYNDVISGKLTFAQAAEQYSDDKMTKFSGGNLPNQQDGGTKIPLDMIDESLVFFLDTMKVGSVSRPGYFISPVGEPGYRMVYYKSKTEPHKCSIKTDYQRVQQMALSKKQQDVVNKWYAEKLEETYLSVDEEYASCPKYSTWKKTK